VPRNVVESGSSVGLTEDEAAVNAVLGVLDGFISAKDVRIHKLGTRREKRRGYNVLQHETCRHVYASYKGISFKGFGKDRIPAKALVLAIIAMANKIAWKELRGREVFEAWEKQTAAATA
jgi:hypothetical protein